MLDYLDQVEAEGDGIGAYSTEKIAASLITLSLMPDPNDGMLRWRSKIAAFSRQSLTEITGIKAAGGVG